MDEGDEAAWQVIIEVYRGLLVAQASRRVIRGLVVEDDGFCEARARRRQAWVSIDEVPPETCVSGDPAAQVIGALAGRDLWAVIDRELGDVQERMVARLSFVSGLSPREILARHPEKFQDVFDVYRTKRNMIERLRRSTALKTLLV
jgi:hypothetical protein